MDYFIDKPELSLGLMYHILAMSCVFRLCFGVLRGGERDGRLQPCL